MGQAGPIAVARVLDREFKRAAVERMLSGENISALARELGVLRKSLYEWKGRYQKGGSAALRTRGRPAARDSVVPAVVPPTGATRLSAEAQALASAREHIVALERKVGQQQLELDFFRRALRQLDTPRPGAAASTT